MHQDASWVTRAAAVLLLLLLFQGDANAYIDPGAGMLAWQGLIAAIGAVLVFVRRPVKAIKAMIERLRRK